MRMMPFYSVIFICLLSFSCESSSETPKTSSKSNSSSVMVVDQNDLNLFENQNINSGKTLITIGKTKVNEGFFDKLSKSIPGFEAKLKQPMYKQKIINSIVEQELLYQAAIKNDFHKDQDVQLRLILDSRSKIASAYLDSELEKLMLDEYNKTKDTDFTRVEIAQIVFNNLTREEKSKKVEVTENHKKATLKLAQETYEKLKNGSDFKTLAKELSQDKRTARRGGKVGFITKNDRRMEKLGQKNVVAKAFELKLNEFSKPIETDNGYVIIKATSKPKVTPFADAKRSLGQRLQKKVKEEVLAKLKKETEIVYAPDSTPKDTQAQPQKETPKKLKLKMKPSAKK